MMTKMVRSSSSEKLGLHEVIGNQTLEMNA